MLIESILIEKVKRINMVIMNLQQQQVGFMPRYSSYTIDMDRERSCYNCESFKHITRHYKNRRVGN